jgi:hypothetical protein
MQYLTEKELAKLGSRRRARLLSRVTAQFADGVEDWLEYEADSLPGDLLRMNKYRRLLNKLCFLDKARRELGRVQSRGQSKPQPRRERKTGGWRTWQAYC